jgi:hypothetical protein
MSLDTAASSSVVATAAGASAGPPAADSDHRLSSSMSASNVLDRLAREGRVPPRLPPRWKDMLVLGRLPRRCMRGGADTSSRSVSIRRARTGLVTAGAEMGGVVREEASKWAGDVRRTDNVHRLCAR